MINADAKMQQQILGSKLKISKSFHLRLNQLAQQTLLIEKQRQETETMLGNLDEEDRSVRMHLRVKKLGKKTSFL